MQKALIILLKIVNIYNIRWVDPTLIFSTIDYMDKSTFHHYNKKRSIISENPTQLKLAKPSETFNINKPPNRLRSPLFLTRAYTRTHRLVVRINMKLSAYASSLSLCKIKIINRCAVAHPLSSESQYSHIYIYNPEEARKSIAT